MATPVTPQEMQSPEYKYYLRDMTAPDPDRYLQIDREPLDPANALTIEHMNDLFLDGYLPGEFGTCVLPNGTAVVANLLKMPGVTIKMVDWWFAWHGLAPIRYKMWDKDEHYDIHTSDPDRRRNPAIPMRERYWDTFDLVSEDNFGTGPREINIHFRNPADIGFDPEKLAAFDGTIICAGDEHAPTVMCHFVRPIPGGVEFRSRFWVGYSIVDGKPVKVLPEGKSVPAQQGKLMLRHNVKEYTNLAAILPEVYAEFKNYW